MGQWTEERLIAAIADTGWCRVQVGKKMTFLIELVDTDLGMRYILGRGLCLKSDELIEFLNSVELREDELLVG